MIGIDLRPFQDPIARGVSSYARPLIEEMVRQQGAGAFRFFATGRKYLTLPSPILEEGEKDHARDTIKHLHVPNKIINSSFAFLHYPAIDKIVGTETFWMPNQNYWAFSDHCRLALTVHDLSFLVEPNWYSAKDRLWHKAIGAVRLIKRADKIITLSQHTAHELNDILKIPAEKICIIPPGIPPLPTAADTLPPRPYPYVLFIGVVEPRKNIAIALAAFELLAQKNKDVHFVIAGHNPTTHHLQPTTSGDRIHFLGQISPQEKTSLLKNARALFFPSLYEGFGFPALEAMAAGVPVVASSAGSLPEAIGNAGALLDPADTAGFAAALEEAVGTGSWRDQLIARGHERIKSFSWEKCAAETIKVLKNF